MPRPRTGVWFIGAKGGVACTATVGLVALKKRLIGQAGLVSELPEFADLGLASWDDFAIGGHEIRQVNLYDEALRLHHESRVIDAGVLQKCKADLDRIDRQIVAGTLLNVGPTIESLAGPQATKLREKPRQAIERIQEDLRQFARLQRLEHLIVVNVASTEPPVDASAWPTTYKELSKRIDQSGRLALPASSLYAIAAMEMGYSYLNFTPSLGSGAAAFDDLARQRATRHMGHDGKTGETLLKSVLAPMFRKRNLQVMSWVGHNIFGNMDARVLDDPENKRAKVTSKDRLLAQILGYPPQTLVSIERIDSMGDWKTAWDHVHFTGFLGTPMTFQFVWQGCDSLLAAPLVLDLVRFTQRAYRHGDTGLLTFLASFFKSPLGVSEQDFGLQFQMLKQWAAAVRGAAQR